MEHKGRILIVEDTSSWQDIFGEALTAQGYDVKQATSYGEAKEILDRRSFDVAIVDIRLSEGDTSNKDGMRVLEKIRDEGDLTSFIIVSGYATVGLTREAFKKYGVLDFLEKDRFQEEEFLDLVKLGVQEARAFGYGETSLYQTLLRDPMPTISTFFPASHDHEELLQEMFAEFWPLSTNPQFMSELIETSEGKNVVQIIGWSKGIGEAIVARLGPSSVIKRESQNYTKHINELNENVKSTIKMEPVYKSGLGGLVYVLKGTHRGHLRNFTSFYMQESANVAKQTVHDVLWRVCTNLYLSRGIDEVEVDISAICQPLYEKLAKYRKEQRRDEERYYAQMDEAELESYLKTQSQKWPVDPIDFVLSQRFTFNSPVSIVHGDLRGGNIIVDSQARGWLLGFYDTGMSDVTLTDADGPESIAFRAHQVGKRNLLHDFATLEVSIRATLTNIDADTRKAFDLALCQPSEFGVPFSFEIANFLPELDKAGAVVAKIRELLFEIVDFKGNMKLYYVELLHQFLHTYMRLPDRTEEKEQMWMSAAIIAERLARWR